MPRDEGMPPACTLPLRGGEDEGPAADAREPGLRVFGKNVILYGIGNISARAASFLLVPIYTYSLSITDYGVLMSLLMTAQLMVVWMGIGSRQGFVRLARECETNSLMGSLLGSSSLLNIAGGVVVTGASVTLLTPLFRSFLHHQQIQGYIALTCGIALFQSLTLLILSYYRARNESKKYIAYNLATTVLQMLLTLVFLRILPFGIGGALGAQAMSYALVWVLISGQVFARERVGVSLRLVRRLLAFGAPLIIVLSGSFLTDITAVYLLGYFKGLEDVAIFSLGGKIASIAIIAFLLPFQLAYEPFVFSGLDSSELHDTISRLVTYMALGFLFIAIGMGFLSRGLIHIIAPPNYTSAFFITILMLPALLFQGIYYFGESLLHIKNKTYITSIIITVLTCVGIILNIIFIPKFGRYAAVMVYNFVLVASGISVMFFGMQHVKIVLDKQRLAIIAGWFVALFTILYMIKNIENKYYYSIIAIFLILLSIFMIVCPFFRKDEKMGILALLRKAG